MAKYLVIVESPAKVKTISKFLGKNYEIMASNGHVRDLPKSQLGVNVDGDYEPKYITIRGKGELLAGLRKSAKKADKIYLATDPDREGEAISWHLTKALKLEDKEVQRITFNEITKTAVKNALKAPREIDMNLVDEQQARRCLDRIVGYSISPLLWQKIRRGLSAGRVQSVTLRLIADREEEINAFVPREYWSLEGDFLTEGRKKPLTARFYGKGKEKLALENEAQVDEILTHMAGKEGYILEKKTGERTRKAPLPFTTSTLQQEASRMLNFSTQKTMRIAQQLYEGVSLKKGGTVGLITYLRTDSTRVSQEAIEAADQYISAQYGAEYSAGARSSGNTNKNAQDAHEAIRPSDINRSPVIVKDSLSRDQFRLYQLIWRRFVASRMTPAVYETYSVKIGVGDYVFTAADHSVKFAGFLSVYTDEEEEKSAKLALDRLEKGSTLRIADFHKEQHFTQPPAHYTEASLVRTMEELGIGRPSTYAPTITTIIQRRYVAKDKKNLFLTELGEVVNNMMKEAFPSIVDVNFTAYMEGLLDCVGAGTVPWKSVLENFWPDLKEALEAAEANLEDVKIADEESDEVCELCGRRMVIKYGPHGKFLGCPGFPECRNTKPYLEKIGVPCPACHGEGEVVIRRTRKGRRYFGCSQHPECEFMSWQQPVSQPCPVCGGYMVLRGRKVVCADAACGYSGEVQKES